MRFLRNPLTQIFRWDARERGQGSPLEKARVVTSPAQPSDRRFPAHALCPDFGKTQQSCNRVPRRRRTRGTKPRERGHGERSYGARLMTAVIAQSGAGADAPVRDSLRVARAVGEQIFSIGAVVPGRAPSPLMPGRARRACAACVSSQRRPVDVQCRSTGLGGAGCPRRGWIGKGVAGSCRRAKSR